MIKISEINKLLKEAISGKYNYALIGMINCKYYYDRLEDEEYIKSEKIYNYLIDNYPILDSYTDDISSAHVIKLNSARNSLDQARRNYVNSLSQYWKGYFNIRKLTLYDFENNRSLIEELDSLLE